MNCISTDEPPLSAAAATTSYTLPSGIPNRSPVLATVLPSLAQSEKTSLAITVPPALRGGGRRDAHGGDPVRRFAVSARSALRVRRTTGGGYRAGQSSFARGAGRGPGNPWRGEEAGLPGGPVGATPLAAVALRAECAAQRRAGIAAQRSGTG